MQTVPVLMKENLKTSGSPITKKPVNKQEIDKSQFNLKLILEKYIGDENKFDFDCFITVLKQKQNDEDFLKIFLIQLRQNVHMLDPKLFENTLINFVFFEIKWSNLNPELFQYLSEFLIDLNSAYTSYIYKCLTILIKNFQISDSKNSNLDELYKMSHTVINHLVKIAPFCKTHLIKQIDALYPYMNKDTNIQQVYIKNILNIIEYIKELRLSLLEICVQKMLKIDVNCRREQILEAELEPVIETNNAEDIKIIMKHELADRLDVMMEQVFLFIKKNCLIDNTNEENGIQMKLNWESTKLFYKDLLFIFDKYILSTYGSSHVQFLMFYICSHRGMLSEGFVDYLWKKFNYSTSSPVTRQICAYYIGSLLARAKFTSLTTCVATLQLILSWIRSYIDKTSNNNHSKFELHRTFYALCQTFFYVIIFRHRQLFQENQPDIIDLVKSWKLNSIVTCKLNPLKYCMKTVRKKFARIAYKNQIAYCYTILDANNRMSIPDAVETNLNMFFGGDSMINKNVKSSSNQIRSNFDNPLDSFFPFDPYLLKRSKRFIEKFYQEFQDDLDDDMESETDEDDDDDEDINDEEENDEDNAIDDDNDYDLDHDNDNFKKNSNVNKYLSTSNMDDSDIDEDTMNE